MEHNRYRELMEIIGVFKDDYHLLNERKDVVL